MSKSKRGPPPPSADAESLDIFGAASSKKTISSPITQPSSSKNANPSVIKLSKVDETKVTPKTVLKIPKVDQTQVDPKTIVQLSKVDATKEAPKTVAQIPKVDNSKAPSNKTVIQIPRVDPTKIPSYAKSIFRDQNDEKMASRQPNIEKLNERDKREQEKWAQTQIRRLGPCPAKLQWRRKEKYYQCEGEHHIVTDLSLADGRGAMYLHPKTLMPSLRENELLWGPYYRDKDGKWKWVSGEKKPKLAPDWYEGTETGWYSQCDQEYFEAAYWDAVKKMNPSMRSEFNSRFQEYPRQQRPSPPKIQKPRTPAPASRTPTLVPKSHIPISTAPALKILPRTAITKAPTEAPSFATVKVSRVDDFEMMKRQTKISTMTGLERKKQDEWAQDYIDRTSACPQGVSWRRFKFGYLCEGGVHVVTDDAIAEGKGAIYIYPRALNETSENTPLWGPYYINPRFDLWKNVPGARQSGAPQYPDSSDKIYEYAGPRPKPPCAPDAWDDSTNTVFYNPREQQMFRKAGYQRTLRTVGNTTPNQQNMKAFVAAIREKTFPGGGTISPPLSDDTGAIGFEPDGSWQYIPCAGRKGAKAKVPEGYVKAEDFRDDKRGQEGFPPGDFRPRRFDPYGGGSRMQPGASGYRW